MLKRKKVILTGLIGFCAVMCSAQISKGTILAGASSNLGFSNYKPDGGTSSTNFNLNARGGYFFIDNFVGGLNLGLGRSDGTNSTFTSTTIGFFGRYYIKGKIFVGGGLDLRNTKSVFGTSTTKASYSQVNINAGYAIFLGQNIAVEPGLNIDIEGGDSAGIRVGLNAGFTLFLKRK